MLTIRCGYLSAPPVKLLTSKYFSRVNLSTNITIPYIQRISSLNYLNIRSLNIVNWYEDLTGMSEVRLCQNRVIAVQNKFSAAQERRRSAYKELNKLQLQLQEISCSQDATNRGETRYVQLVTKEHEILKDERKLRTEFVELEKEERESFTLLATCVRESHEKERAQADRNKYFSIIGSILGTVVGIAGSAINNHFKMKESRELVDEKVKSSSSNLTQIKNKLLPLIKACSIELPAKDVAVASQEVLGVINRLEGKVDKLLSWMKILEDKVDMLCWLKILESKKQSAPEALKLPPKKDSVSHTENMSNQVIKNLVSQSAKYVAGLIFSVGLSILTCSCFR